MTGERGYIEILREIVSTDFVRPDRTGTGTLGVFGRQMRFDLRDGFPLLTTKRLPFRIIALELLWMLSGSTNARDLQADGVHIWDEWAGEHGDLGPIYGKQWRSWDVPDGSAIDQIAGVVRSLRDAPYGRRHVVSAWNPADVDDMALPPCHCLFQFYVERGGRLSCQVYQRSGDMFLGVPFNIASYALLTMMMAKVVGLAPGELVHTLGDAHLYINHLEQAKTQATRELRPFPRLFLSDKTSIDDWKITDFALSEYRPHPHIAGEVAI